MILPIDILIYPRQETTTSTSTTSTTSSSTSTSASTPSSSATATPSSVTSTITSTPASSTASSTSSSSSSTSSISSISSSTSASASATQTPAPSNSNAKEIGGIVGGVIAGLALLTIISVLFTTYRRRRNDARKRPRNSVFLGHSAGAKGEIDKTQLEAFLSPTLNPSHQADRSSSIPLLSLQNEEDLARLDSANESSSQPRDSEGVGRLTSPYSDDGHGPGANNVDKAKESAESNPPALLPSPYSQHGHGPEEPESPPAPPLPAPQPLPVPRPGSELFAPLTIQPGDFSLAALEATMAASRSGSTTPTSLSKSLDTPGIPLSIPEPVTMLAAASSAKNSEPAASEAAVSNSDAQSSHDSNQKHKHLL